MRCMIFGSKSASAADLPPSACVMVLGNSPASRGFVPRKAQCIIMGVAISAARSRRESMRRKALSMTLQMSLGLNLSCLFTHRLG